MKTNVEKVLERDQKLSELDDRAGRIHMLFSVRYLRLFFPQACEILIRKLSSTTFF